MLINIDNDTMKKLIKSKLTHPTLSYSDIILAWWGCSSEEAKYRSMERVQQDNEMINDPRNYLFKEK